MADREYKRKSPSHDADDAVAEPVARGDSGEKIKSELDDLLDEIDDVLEENAEEFVKSYVQKGGQ